MRDRCCSILILAMCIVAVGRSPTAYGQANVPKPKMDQAPGASEPGKPPTDVQPGDDLSEKLSRSEGVIRPPAGIDPEMHKSAPGTSSPMPVLPPPGSPGGRQDIRPK